MSLTTLLGGHGSFIDELAPRPPRIVLRSPVLSRRDLEQLSRSPALAPAAIDLVFPAVGGCRAPLDVGERAREHVEIVGQRGGEERQAHRNARAGEFIDGARRQNFEPRLRQFVARLAVAAHDSMGLTVNARIGGERIRLARPVFRAVAIQVVGHRPDTEIGIVGHQRNRRRTNLCNGANRA